MFGLNIDLREVENKEQFRAVVKATLLSELRDKLETLKVTVNNLADSIYATADNISGKLKEDINREGEKIANQLFNFFINNINKSDIAVDLATLIVLADTLVDLATMIQNRALNLIKDILTQAGIDIKLDLGFTMVSLNELNKESGKDGENKQDTGRYIA